MSLKRLDICCCQCQPNAEEPKSESKTIPDDQNPQDLRNEEEILSKFSRPPSNPMYETSNSEYGKYKPTIHTMPIEFHNRKGAFTRKYMRSGNYRNHSFNTAKDPSYI
ncbi:unnamed protein product [Hymenolepis diminuta]|uniref:Uncharacterized protein n=1 Tax=Hymenolepis diminuta TaxID=6216 RepID=A0A564XWK8_HYMDI|nr:unnamed protein product [Hymenolepis diminuta]